MNRKSAVGMQVRAFDYDVKAVAEDGKFSGYGSVFGTVDSYKEIVVAGAFLESLAGFKKAGRNPPVLWQHRSAEPIGNWDIDTLKEDSRGLHGDGQLWLAESQYAKIAQRGMQTKSITGLSIGYYVRDSSYDEKTGIRTLKALDLVEISIVTNPANPDAQIDAIKSRIAHGAVPSLKDFEQFLREAGFSKSQATIIASRGLSHLLRSESAGVEEEKAVIGQLNQALDSFELPKII